MSYHNRMVPSGVSRDTHWTGSAREFALLQQVDTERLEALHQVSELKEREQQLHQELLHLRTELQSQQSQNAELSRDLAQAQAQIEPLQAQIGPLQAQLEAARDEARRAATAARSEPAPSGADASPDDLQQRYLRLKADMDNMRRRQGQQVTQEVASAKVQVFADLLPALDDLARARNAPAGATLEHLREGLQAIEQQLYAALRKQGVERLDVDAGAFDPESHEAVGIVPSTDRPQGHIVECVRPGYRLGGRLLRPAQVRVAGPPEEGNGP